MAKMIMTSQGLKIDPAGKRVDQLFERRDELNEKLNSLSSWQWGEKKSIRAELKRVNKSIRMGVAFTTGIDPGRG